LWIVGYSTGIAYTSIKPDETKTTLFKFISLKKSTKEHVLLWYKLIKRTLLLFFFGMVLNLLSVRFQVWGAFRIPGVLQRISICFFFISCLHNLVENVYLQMLIVSFFQLIYIFGMFFIQVPSHKGKSCGRGVVTDECR
jgi:predicted acyltransferase